MGRAILSPARRLSPVPRKRGCAAFNADTSRTPRGKAANIGYLSHTVPQSAEPVRVDYVPASRLSIEKRFVALAILLTLEGLLIFVHVRDVQRSSIARWGCAFASIFVAFAYPRVRGALAAAAGRVESRPLSWRSLTGHIIAMTLFLLLASPSFVNSLSGATAILVAAAWCVAGVAGVAFAALVFMPAPIWTSLLRRTGYAWIYAMAGGTAASVLAPYLWLVWDRFLLRPATAVTFAAVKLLIGPFLPDMIADPATRLIGSGRFEVILAGPCSGWEGVGLAFVFGLIWLWVSRRDCRFPRAFILIPAAMAIMFGLNILRIAALILIGSAGAARVAVSGFHSQAGWIAFNAVALGIAWITPKIDWIMIGDKKQPQASPTVVNRTVPYLLPFAAILAAGMVSRAASDRFEWLYPLRFFAAAIALWFGRREYATLKWRPGWLSVFAGAVVFALWYGLDWFAFGHAAHPDNGIASGLGALSRPARIAWISFRTLAAITTVPLAEELAFRGFLLRRMISAEFESVGFQKFTWPALMGSSLLFGLMHGERWIAGTLAGVVYAAVMLRRGGIGEAVAAHATTNALLAVCVLSGNNWYFW